ncbi:MAG: RDD family protein [Haliscomenobacter sp.]|nr:RDD family protein [Haliscomenobacter sp.]
MKIFALAQSKRLKFLVLPSSCPSVALKNDMQPIGIQTPQNVRIEYEPAALRDRMLAFFIDALIVVAGYSLVLWAILSNSFGQGLLEVGWWMNLLFVFIPLGLFFGYHFLFETFWGGQSPGKRAMGIRVIRLDGREPQPADYLLRAFFQLVDTLTSMGILAALLISSTARGQRLGDIAAHTVVVRQRNMIRFALADILRINSLEDYTPTYEQVKTLSEQDMLTVKNALARYQTFRNAAHAAAIIELTDRLCAFLNIEPRPENAVEFLKILLRDYIVLTR